MKPLSQEAASAVYALLMEKGGAHPHDRDHFIFTQSSQFCGEWRFQGKLGFGGKFYRDGNRWRVGLYREDETPERLQIVDEINDDLDVLFKKYCSLDENFPIWEHIRKHCGGIVVRRSDLPSLASYPGMVTDTWANQLACVSPKEN